jgi:hypothetical protein
MSKASVGQKKKNNSRNLVPTELFTASDKNFLKHNPFGAVTLAENNGSKEMGEYLWPFALNYHNPLNPVLLAQIEDLDQLSKASSWFVRDGKIALIYFFEKFPAPKKNTGILFISESFAGLVPAVWRKNTNCYSLYQKNSANRPNKILLSGLACLAAGHESQRSQLLSQIKKKFNSEELRQKKIYVFVPSRHFNFMKEQTFHAEFFYHLFRFFPGEVEIVNWNFLTTLKNFNDFLLVDLNPDTIWSDSYLTYYVLSKGGSVFDVPIVKSIEQLDFPLSNYHGLKTKPLSAADAGDKTSVLKLKDDPAFYALPWRSWFDHKALIK